MQLRTDHISVWTVISVLLVICTQVVYAIHEDQAGVLDWHHAWIAALNASTGEIEWRQLLNNPIRKFQLHNEGLLTVTDEESPLVQVWESNSGKLIWEDSKVDDLSKDSKVVDAVILSSGDVAILTSSGSVVIRTIAGGQHWRWIPELGSSTIPIALAENNEDLYAINGHKGVLSNSLQVHKLDAQHGIVQSEHKVSASLNDLRNFVVVNNNIVWIEKHHLKINELGSTEVSSTSIESSKVFASQSILPDSYSVAVLDPKSNEVLVTAQTAKEDVVYFISAIAKIEDKKADFILELDMTSHPYSASSLDNTVVAVQHRSEDELAIIAKAAGVPSTDVIRHTIAQTGQVEFVSLISLQPLRTLIVTADASIRIYEGSILKWSREESLAYVTDSEFIDLPEQKLWSQMADETSEDPSQHSPFERYVHRLQSDLKKLPTLPSWFMSRFSGVIEALQRKRQSSPLYLAQQSLSDPTNSTLIYRDNFGLRKLIVSATSTGKIVAQDTQNQGKIVWAKYHPGVQFKQVISVRSATVKMPPIIVVTGENVESGTMLIYRLNALNGNEYVTEDANIAEYFDPVLETPTIATKIFRLPIEEPDERTHVLALYDAASTRVFIYPDTEGSRSAFQNFLPSFYFSLVNNDSTAIKGYRVVEGYRGSLTASPVWSFAIPKGSTLAAVGSRSAFENVASIGRVLGNRNVLYKYLNPNLFAVAHANPDTQSMTMTLLDGVKGSVLYQVVHEDVDTVHHGVHIGTSENWVVYHYWTNGATRASSKGYQVSVLELFEGVDENERVESDKFSSYDNQQPHIRSESFVFPYGVRTLGITDTRNGVSTREVLFGLTNNQIYGVSRRMLDVRRPREKPSKEAQEEQLIPYGPIPDERKMFASYSLEILGMNSIITAPALLESTSLVFAYGLDTFFTYRAPSRQFDVLSEDFNKSQLLLTIVGLAVGIMMTGPMVRRKRVNALWK
ncbi:unnamed protein product [Umbelopsis sp. WA50703]